MKLHFEPNLDFQLQAIESACDLFSGPGNLPNGVYGYQECPPGGIPAWH